MKKIFVLIILFASILLNVNFVSSAWTTDLNNGLTDYWTYDIANATGNATYNNITGTYDRRIYGANFDFATGLIQKGLNFTNLGSFSVVNRTFNYNVSFTENFWIKGVFDKASQNFVFKTSSSLTGTDEIMEFNVMGNGTFGFAPTQADYGYPQGNITLANNTWHMVTITNDGVGIGTFRVFIDGVLGYIQTRTETADLTAKYSQLQSPFPTVSVKHLIVEEHGRWNVSLNETKITQLYNSGAGITYNTELEISLNSPSNDAAFLSNVVNFSTTITDSSLKGVKNVSLLINGTINQTNSSYLASPYYFNNTAFSIGKWNWSIEAYDNSSNRYVSATRNFTVNKLAFLQNSYQPNATEQTTQTFYTNITLNSGYSISAVNITYNQTNYSATFSSVNTSTYQASATILVPSVATDSNKTFNWTVLLTDGTYTISSSYNQTVIDFGMDDCSAHTIQILNFSMFDEDLQSNLSNTDVNTSVKVDVSLYPNGTKSVATVTYSHDYSKINPARVCISDALGTSIYYMDVQVRYGADTYATEYYHIQNYSLNATLNPSQNITLYDLATNNSQAFKITYRDSSFLPVQKALIQVQRKFVDLGLSKTVEIPLTDTSGETIAHLVKNDVIYTFTVTKNGVVLATFENVYAVCQNPTLETCEIELNSFASTIPSTSLTTGDDFTYTLTYDKTTRTISSTFSIPSGAVSLVTLNISQEDALGTSVCNQSITTSAGTLSCVLGNSVGNSTVLAQLYKDGGLIAQGQFKLDMASSDIYGGAVIVLGIFLLMTLVGAGISANPTFTAIFYIFGIILLFALNIVTNNGFIGGTVLYIIIAIILLIIKGANRS